MNGNSYISILTGLDDTYALKKAGYWSRETGELKGYVETGLTAAIARGAPKNIFGIMLGTNDILYGNATIAFINIANIIKKHRALNGDTVTRYLVATVPSRTGCDTAKNALNTLLRANWPQFADGLCDIAANPLFGADGASTNLTYYQDDGIHFAQPMHNGMSVMLAASINAVWYADLKQPNAVSATTYTQLAKDMFIRYTGATGGNITLFTAVGNTGQVRRIKNATANSLTLTAASGQAINGASTYTLAAGATVNIISVLVSAAAGGANWETV